MIRPSPPIPLARPDDDHITCRQRRRIHHGFVPVRADDGGTFGSKIEQAAHRVGGALGQECFQRAGGGEDDDQQAAVEDLADRRGADRGDDLEQVDVEGFLSKRLQARQCGLPPAGDVAAQIQRPPQPGRGTAELSRQARGRTARSRWLPTALPGVRTAGCGRRLRPGAPRARCVDRCVQGWSWHGFRLGAGGVGTNATIQENMKTSSCNP